MTPQKCHFNYMNSPTVGVGVPNKRKGQNEKVLL